MPGRTPLTEDLSRWRVITALAISLLAVAVVAVLATVVRSQPEADAGSPLGVAAVAAPAAQTSWCAGLMAALPDQLAGSDRREIVGAPEAARGVVPPAPAGDPSDPATGGSGADSGDISDVEVGAVAAWGEPAVILRCGLPTPQELTCTSPIQVVDGVSWLPLHERGVVTYVAVDRPVRVALTVPETSTTGPWQSISRVVGQTLPQQPVCAGGQIVGAAGP